MSAEALLSSLPRLHLSGLPQGSSLGNTSPLCYQKGDEMQLQLLSKARVIEAVDRRRVRTRICKSWMLNVQQISMEPVIIVGRESSYAAYQMTLRNICGQQWQVYHRYTGYRTFRKTLLRLLKDKQNLIPDSKKHRQRLVKLGFPGKFVLNKTQGRVVAQRTVKLREFVVAVVDILRSVSLAMLSRQATATTTKLGPNLSAMSRPSNSTSSTVIRFTSEGANSSVTACAAGAEMLTLLIRTFLDYPAGHEEEVMSAMASLSDVDANYLQHQDQECSICLEDFENATEAVKTSCNHYFHESCALEWMQQKLVCAYCNTSLCPRKSNVYTATPTTIIRTPSYVPSPASSVASTMLASRAPGMARLSSFGTAPQRLGDIVTPQQHIVAA